MGKTRLQEYFLKGKECECDRTTEDRMVRSTGMSKITVCPHIEIFSLKIRTFLEKVDE